MVDQKWQLHVSFPGWMGKVDDSLALNAMCSFLGFHGQGYLLVKVKEEVETFKIYVNGVKIDGSLLVGKECEVDISSIAVDGMNTLQVSNIKPYMMDAVEVFVPYPCVLAGDVEEVGINRDSLRMVENLIEADIEHGFPSAQLAIVRNGRLVYENAWGKVNSYHPDGSRFDGLPVTVDTLYDLASVTKMFAVNYALQKLVSDGDLDLDCKVCEFLGQAFSEDAIVLEDCGFSLERIKEWKREISIRDLLKHQAGFMADPKYSSPYLDAEKKVRNPLFAGNGADEETREKTIEMICRTPLEYEPGSKTVYSDVDYMILGLVVENKVGMDLDEYLKKVFCEPMGLKRMSYNPLEHGFGVEGCAATELNGNTRDHLLDFDGYRVNTIQGQVHDEKAYYNMMGISGHAGLFACARDLAILASVMLTGGYDRKRFFSRNVMDAFCGVKKEDAGSWGLGWWRQGDLERPWYFGTQASSNVIGHTGWTGSFVMIDGDRNLVIVYLTNKINTCFHDGAFDGNWYTASTYGFIPQILSIGMDSDVDVSRQLVDLMEDMVVSSEKLIVDEDHPSFQNYLAKKAVWKKMRQ